MRRVKQTIWDTKRVVYQQYITLCRLLLSCTTEEQIKNTSLLYNQVVDIWEFKFVRITEHLSKRKRKQIYQIFSELTKALCSAFTDKLKNQQAVVAEQNKQKTENQQTEVAEQQRIFKIEVKGFC